MGSLKNGVVIIGAGHAGVQAAVSLRDDGFDGPVTLVGDENELPYHKPPLSKAFLKDAATGPQILRSEGFYAGASISLRLGERVERINAATRRLTFTDGAELEFDRLILATGSRPRPTALEGGDLDGVLSLRSLADARAIRDRMASVEDVVVLGGGFIGLEIAATLAAGGRRVTVVEAQPRLLGRAVAPVVAGHVMTQLAASGVRILTATTVDRLEGAGGTVAAALTSGGERIAAGMVIVGIGAVPNSELADGAGLAIGNGIRVDGQLRTSHPEILAIGDSANFHHAATGMELRLESVQNATDQARLAARTILGHDDVYTSVPWFWSDIGDMKLQMVGLVVGCDEAVTTGDVAGNKFSVFHYRAGQLAAIESVNRPADHMLGRRMIGAGFSPDHQAVLEGTSKEAFTRWQESNKEATA